MGTDVATVRTEGIEFPFPGYLQNIVRQVSLSFKWSRPGALKAEVFFFIRRDGSVTGFRFIASSGNYAFDLQPGQLVLFPSWVQHQVMPFYGEGERITVAFNCAMSLR